MSKRKKRAHPVGSAQPRRAQPRRLRSIETYCAVGTAAAAALVYLNAFGRQFVLDDVRLIHDNPRIRSLANVPHLFASSYWDVQGAQALYRPLVLASYAVNYAIHGLSTYGYMATNVALHVTVSVLLFALVRAIGGSLFAATAAGLVFAVHPVHTEAVTGISGRSELLAALFFLAAILLHHMARRVGPGAIVFRAGTAACFGLALLGKESAMTLILVVPAMDALVSAPRQNREPVNGVSRVLTDYVSLVAVALGYLAVRRAVLGSITIAEGAIAPLDNPLVPVTTMPLGERMGATPAQAVMTAFAVMAEYARLLVWPARLSADYSYSQILLVTSARDPRFLAGAVLAAACVAGVVLLWRRRQIAAFGLAFFLLTFSIVSNLVVRIGTVCAERLMYLPSAGLCIAVAIGAERMTTTSRAWRRITYGVLAVSIVLASARTWTRNRDWANEVTLWTAAIQAAPHSARVQYEYGRLLLNQAQDAAQAGQTAEAERLYGDARTHLATAVTIFPSYSLPIDGLAIIASLRGRYDEALPLYARALQAWPGNYASLTNWASAQWEQSRRTGQRASELRAQGRMAEADELGGQADRGCRQALEKIDRAIALMPSYAQAHLVRATMLETYVGDTSGAIAEFEEVLRLMPDHPQRALIEQELQRLRTQRRRDG
jgi:tetratricopeptide (TPR) repeat protein